MFKKNHPGDVVARDPAFLKVAAAISGVDDEFKWIPQAVVDGATAADLVALVGDKYKPIIDPVVAAATPDLERTATLSAAICVALWMQREKFEAHRRARQLERVCEQAGRAARISQTASEDDYTAQFWDGSYRRSLRRHARQQNELAARLRASIRQGTWASAYRTRRTPSSACRTRGARPERRPRRTQSVRRTRARAPTRKADPDLDPSWGWR